MALAYRLVSGVGFSLFGIARHAYFTEYSKVANRGQSLALFGRLVRVGQFVGPVGGRFGGGIEVCECPFWSLPSVVFLPCSVSCCSRSIGTADKPQPLSYCPESARPVGGGFGRCWGIGRASSFSGGWPRLRSGDSIGAQHHHPAVLPVR